MYSYISKRGVLVVVLFLLATSFVQAFGVSAPYIQDDILRVNPGKTYTYTITVQNGDEEDYFVKINHTRKDIVSLAENTKYIYSKSYNTTFTFLILVPEKTLQGTEYNMEYTARPITNQSDAVSIGVEIKRNLKIIVTDKEGNLPTITPEIPIYKNDIFKKSLTYVSITLAVLLGIFIALRLWKMSRNISEKIYDKKSNYTIKESKNIPELQKLIDKMSDKEFDLPIVKHLIRDKLSEFNDHHLAHQVHSIDRTDLIKKLDKYHDKH